MNPVTSPGTESRSGRGQWFRSRDSWDQTHGQDCEAGVTHHDKSPPVSLWPASAAGTHDADGGHPRNQHYGQSVSCRQ